jgi:hypothetical protein
VKIKSTIFAIAVSANVLTACGGGNSQWCEFDSTDQVVDDSFCQAGTPGYEWEHGSDSTKRKKVKRAQRTLVIVPVKPRQSSSVYRVPAPKRSVPVHKAPAKKK